MGKRKKRREHSGSGGSSSNSSDTKLVSSVLNETNAVLHGETVMQSSAQLNAPVQHLATSTPVMNSQQQYMQMLNSPILSPSLNQADVHNAPPWAVALANSIRSVDQKVDDVSKKLQKLERVEAKMADFEKELSNLRMEISQSRVKTEEMLTALNDRADSVEFQFGCVTDRLATIEAENKSLKGDIIDMKSRSMRDNLIFSNIPEKENETPDVTEHILREFLEVNLKMEKQDVTNIRFDRVHRIHGQRKPRAIVAKFCDFKQRQIVRGKSRALKGTNYYINEQFPPEINSERKELVKVMKEKRQQGHKTRLVYNKLYVDDILYKPPAKQTHPNA